MRDIVQNHVLQVLPLALMEPPASFDAEAIRNEKVKLFQSIQLPTTSYIDRIAVRGQYSRGGTRDELMPGRRSPFSGDHRVDAGSLPCGCRGLGEIEAKGIVRRAHRLQMPLEQVPRDPTTHSSVRRLCTHRRPSSSRR